MKFTCNGLFVSSADASVRFSPEAPFDTAYGEPWFLKNPPYDPGSLFPRKNTLRVITNIKTLLGYMTGAGVMGIDPSVWLLYSPLEAPLLNHTVELRLREISSEAGYDILSLSVNYSLVYDVLEKYSGSGEIDFSEEETLFDRVCGFREKLNGRLLFDDPADCSAFLDECRSFFAESCEKLVIPGWEDITLSKDPSGAPVNDNIICRIAKVDADALFDCFKDYI